MNNVLLLPSRKSVYVRPPLAWITRRARRIQRVYGVARRMAIYDAWRDYIDFTGAAVPRLVAVKGACHG